MAVIERDKNGHVLDEEFDGDCCFCGGRPHGAWSTGEQHILVCNSCSLNILPKLIADAVTGSVPFNPHRDQHKNSLQLLQLNYWRAVATHLHGEKCKPPAV